MTVTAGKDLCELLSAAALVLLQPALEAGTVCNTVAPVAVTCSIHNLSRGDRRKHGGEILNKLGEEQTQDLEIEPLCCLWHSSCFRLGYVLRWET